MSASNPGDRELEQLLADTAGLKQRYQAYSQDEPSPAIDNVIRAAARREVRARPRPAGSPFSGSWRIPVSIAAVVVLSATVTLLITERGTHLPDAGKPRQLGQRTDAQALDATANPRLETTQRPASPDATTGFKPEMRAKSAAREAETPEPKIAEPHVREGTMPEARIPEEETSVPSTASKYRQHPFPAQTKPTPAAPANAAAPPAPAAPISATKMTGDVAAGPASPELPTSSPPSPQDALRDAGPKRDTAEETRGEASAAKAGPVQQAPAAAAAPVPPASATRSASVASDSAVADQRNTRARRLTKEEAAPAVTSSESPAGPWERDPKAWLKHIDDLRTAGLIDDAKASFKTFRSRYPDYPLPADFVIPGA